MSVTVDYDEAYAQRQLQRSRHRWRRLIKEFYLDEILRDIDGPTLDIGCGAGQLLQRLPAGSLGLEVNAALVRALQKEGLDVRHYDFETDQFRFTDLPTDRFRTLVLAHVLEHFENPPSILSTLLSSARRLGIQRAIFIVPGAKGFAFDKTHRTFVNRNYLQDQQLTECVGYRIKRQSYFPINAEAVGRYFTFHEFKFVYERIDG